MVKLRIPATSANIGPGFDSIGLAVNLYNQITMEEWDGCSIQTVEGPAAPTDESNLIYSTAKNLYRVCGIPFKGLRITQANRIPFARGLGSNLLGVADWSGVGNIVPFRFSDSHPMETRNIFFF